MAARRTPQIRARDADRNDTCQILDGALAEGQLTMAEHQSRVAAATKASTLGELDALVTDLQPSTATVGVGSSSAARRWMPIAAAAGAVLAIGVVIAVLFSDGGPDSASSAPTTTTEPVARESPRPTKAADPGAAPDDVAPSVLAMPKQLHTLGGMTGLLEQMRKRFGDTTGIELAITPDDAMLYRQDPADEHSKLLYRFNGGWGDPTRRPRDEGDDPADLGAFDVKAVAEVLRAAPETLGIAPTDLGDVVVDIDQVGGALELLVKADKKSGGEGYIYLDSAGNTKRVEYPN